MAADPAGRVAGERHRQDHPQRGAEEREPEMDRVQAGLLLDCRDPRRPRAVEEPLATNAATTRSWPGGGGATRAAGSRLPPGESSPAAHRQDREHDEDYEQRAAQRDGSGQGADDRWADQAACIAHRGYSRDPHRGRDAGLRTAARKSVGTTAASPSPIIPNPTIATTGIWAASASASPTAARAAPH